MPSDQLEPPAMPAARERSVPPGETDLEILEKFRQQIHALGALWIVMGAVSSGVGALNLYRLWMAWGTGVSRDAMGSLMAAGAVTLGLGTVYIALGVLTCLKKMRAVTAGLVLSYLCIVPSLAHCLSLIANLLGIAQAHRVRGFARQLTARGVPLTRKPFYR